MDGVLTDGSIYVGPDNMEFKRFTVEDGVGAALARQAQLPLAIISGRLSPATTERAKQLKIEDVYQGQMDKLKPFEELLLAARDYDATSIVMGTSCKSPQKEFFSRSCAYRVAEEAIVPTLVVPISSRW